VSHILVVDDDDGNRQLVAAILRDEGYEVSEAADGQQALDHLKTAQPKAIVLDLMMPVVDGFTFLVERRKLPNRAAIPVVGDQGSFKVPGATDACNTFATVTATFKYISEKVIIYSDNASPSNGFTSTDFQQIGEPGLVDAFVAGEIAERTALRPGETEASAVVVETAPEEARDIIDQKAETAFEIQHIYPTIGRQADSKQQILYLLGDAYTLLRQGCSSRMG